MWMPDSGPAACHSRRRRPVPRAVPGERWARAWVQWLQARPVLGRELVQGLGAQALGQQVVLVRPVPMGPLLRLQQHLQLLARPGPRR
jgi:hypothetical protein